MRISGITYVPPRTNNTRKVFKFILFLLLLSAILVLLISSYNAWKILHPPRTAIPPFKSDTFPQYKEISFSDIKYNVNLEGWFFQAAGSDKTLILAHSHGRNRMQFGLETLNLVKGFLNKGYNVLIFDFRNSGSSSGKLSTMGYFEKYDVLGAVRYAKEQGSRHIAVMGFATGASAAILAAAEIDISESKDIQAIIADSPYADMEQFIYERLPEWSRLPYMPFKLPTLWSIRLLSGMDPDDANLLQVMEKTAPRPVLFIHSKDDTYTNPEDTRELYNIYSNINKNAADYWETQDSSHAESYLKQPQAYMNRVLNFLETKASFKR